MYLHTNIVEKIYSLSIVLRNLHNTLNRPSHTVQDTPNERAVIPVVGLAGLSKAHVCSQKSNSRHRYCQSRKIAYAEGWIPEDNHVGAAVLTPLNVSRDHFRPIVRYQRRSRPRVEAYIEGMARGQKEMKPARYGEWVDIVFSH